MTVLGYFTLIKIIIMTANWYKASALRSIRIRINVIIALIFITIIYLQHEWILNFFKSMF